MTSLLIVKNSGTGADPGDLSSPVQRFQGQKYVGQLMEGFFVDPAVQKNPRDIVLKTLEECVKKGSDYTVWLLFDDTKKATINEEGVKKRKGYGNEKKVVCEYTEFSGTGTGKLVLTVEEDGGRREKKNKRMTVTLPYDRFAGSDRDPFDGSYTKHIAEDINEASNDTEIKQSLLSTLTFRRCL